MTRYQQRSSRHSYLRTLCFDWIRKHKPVVLRLLRKKAHEKYPRTDSTAVNSNNNEGR